MLFVIYKNITNRGVWLTQKKITSTIINADKYADFMINANKNADSMFKNENF